MFPVRLLFDKLSLNLRPSASLGVWGGDCLMHYLYVNW